VSILGTGNGVPAGLRACARARSDDGECLPLKARDSPTQGRLIPSNLSIMCRTDHPGCHLPDNKPEHERGPLCATWPDHKVIQEGCTCRYPIITSFSQERRKDPSRMVLPTVTGRRSGRCTRASHPWVIAVLSLVTLLPAPQPAVCVRP